MIGTSVSLKWEVTVERTPHPPTLMGDPPIFEE